MECSNAGICNYDTGECTCFEGYDGISCSRKQCPNDCSGHGICVSISEMSSNYGVDTVPGTGGDGVGSSYTNWDKNNLYGCVCDWGFGSLDCSSRKLMNTCMIIMLQLLSI